jgi:hypothetical protein
MNRNLPPGYAQALEACAWDALGFKQMLLSIRDHPDAPLLIQGFLAPAAMYVVESHNCLTTIIPQSQKVLSASTADFLRSSRHRAKLLDDSRKTIKEVSLGLVQIARQQRRVSLEPHSGILAPLKRAIQPDMGLSLYNRHLFWTTHATVFSFGDNIDPTEASYEFGSAVGEYLAIMLDLLNLHHVSLSESSPLSGSFEMRDIKYEQLYGRGSLGSEGLAVGAALILLFAAVNFAQHIVGGLLPGLGHTQFRLKFVTAYHAASGLRLIQDGLLGGDMSNKNSRAILAELVGHPDSRWLRKRRSLRNLLAHYLPDPKANCEISFGDTRTATIERLAGRSLDSVNILIDRYLSTVAAGLQKGFELDGDPFWLGRVR